MFFLRERQTGPYREALTVNLSHLKTVRVAYSGGRVAKIWPFSTSASWANSALLITIMVLEPSLRVKIGPYLGKRSLVKKKKCLPEAATWKRFPTSGQPGGPGGRLRGGFDLDLRDSKKMKKVDRSKASVVKMMW